MSDSEIKMIRVDAFHPDHDTIKKAGKILTQQGVVIFPAQCLYGVAANALAPDAVEKVFQLKQRPKSNPILVLIKNKTDLKSLVKTVPERAERLMAKFWPGNITLVFEAATHVSPRLTANTNKIGIRLPGHPVARALVTAVDFPITGTSANLSGQPGCHQATDLPTSIVKNADMILDAGPVKGGAGSTIVDVTQDPITILRHGAVSEENIRQALS